MTGGTQGGGPSVIGCFGFVFGGIEVEPISCGDAVDAMSALVLVS